MDSLATLLRLRAVKTRASSATNVGDPEHYGVVEFAERVKPSARGELEITDLNRMYFEAGALNVRTLGRGYAWLDTGTMDSLFEAGEFVRTVQKAQGLPISIVEEIAYENGWITRDELMEFARRYGKSPYGQHLNDIVDGRIKLCRTRTTELHNA